MSSVSDEYRRMAAQARLNADMALLPNVKKLHLESAERFDQLAEQIENVAKTKARNDAANLADTLVLANRTSWPRHG